jgi:hypothetical protein
MRETGAFAATSALVGGADAGRLCSGVGPAVWGTARPRSAPREGRDFVSVVGRSRRIINLVDRIRNVSLCDDAPYVIRPETHARPQGAE